MKKQFQLFAVILMLSINAQAKIWRVNSDITKDPDFTTPAAAITAAANGDTIHIEPSQTSYGSFAINKALTFIGNGYFLTRNPGLQANTDSSLCANITFTNAAGGSKLMGLEVFGSITFQNVSNITLTRCLIAGILFSTYTTAGTGISISKCFIEGNVTNSGFSGAGSVNAVFENNIFSNRNGIGGGTFSLDNLVSGLFRNNIINTNTIPNLSNFYIANNIYTQNFGATINGSNNTFRNNSFVSNITTPVGLNGTNGNVTNILQATMAGYFTGNINAGGGGDIRFQLTAGGNTALGSGETISAITPNRGAWEGTDPYKLSGIPALPAIYALTVPVSVSPVATSMSVTISTRSNN